MLKNNSLLLFYFTFIGVLCIALNFVGFSKKAETIIVSQANDSVYPFGLVIAFVMTLISGFSISLAFFYSTLSRLSSVGYLVLFASCVHLLPSAFMLLIRLNFSEMLNSTFYLRETSLLYASKGIAYPCIQFALSRMNELTKHLPPNWFIWALLADVSNSVGLFILVTNPSAYGETPSTLGIISAYMVIPLFVLHMHLLVMWIIKFRSISRNTFHTKMVCIYTTAFTLTLACPTITHVLVRVIITISNGGTSIGWRNSYMQTMATAILSLFYSALVFVVLGVELAKGIITNNNITENNINNNGRLAPSQRGCHYINEGSRIEDAFVVEENLNTDTTDEEGELESHLTSDLDGSSVHSTSYSVISEITMAEDNECNYYKHGNGNDSVGKHHCAT